MANFWVMNHDESVWEKPHEFNPRRFLDDKGDLRNLTNEFPFFMPFSTGQRACLGKNIGKSVIFMLTACLLQRLTFELPPGVKANLKPDIHFDLVPTAYKIVSKPRDVHTQEVFSKVWESVLMMVSIANWRYSMICFNWSLFKTNFYLAKADWKSTIKMWPLLQMTDFLCLFVS